MIKFSLLFLLGEVHIISKLILWINGFGTSSVNIWYLWNIYAMKE